MNDSLLQSLNLKDFTAALHMVLFELITTGIYSPGAKMFEPATNSVLVGVMLIPK